MKPWRITWRGTEFTDDDLTVQDLCAMQVFLNRGYGSLDPWAGPLELAVCIAAYVARVKELPDMDGIIAEVQSAPAVELLTALEPRSLD